MKSSLSAMLGSKHIYFLFQPHSAFYSTESAKNNYTIFDSNILSFSLWWHTKLSGCFFSFCTSHHSPFVSCLNECFPPQETWMEKRFWGLSLDTVYAFFFFYFLPLPFHSICFHPPYLSLSLALSMDLLYILCLMFLLEITQ